MANHVIQQLSIERLLNSFRAGLLALVPIFESANLPWKEPDAYDEWDSVAAALYQGIVGSAVANAKFDSPIYGLIPYDKRVHSYSKNSFIGEADNRGHSAFICFETDIEPFDTCVFSALDLKGTVSNIYKKNLSDVRPVFVPRGTNGVLKSDKASVFSS